MHWDWDIDEDGCIDDSDGDLVGDNIDDCPQENATLFDKDSDGCIDDSDNDGIHDNLDVCFTPVVSIFWPVDSLGCRPADSLPIIDFTLSPEDGGEWYDVLLVECCRASLVLTAEATIELHASHCGEIVALR